jgi:hypothetical protein
LKRRLYCEKVFDTSEFGVYHITPCSAKMVSINNPMFLKSSYLDGALGINEVFELMSRKPAQLGGGHDPSSLQRRGDRLGRLGRRDCRA